MGSRGFTKQFDVESLTVQSGATHLFWTRK